MSDVKYRIRKKKSNEKIKQVDLVLQAKNSFLPSLLVEGLSEVPNYDIVAEFAKTRKSRSKLIPLLLIIVIVVLVVVLGGVTFVINENIRMLDLNNVETNNFSITRHIAEITNLRDVSEELEARKNTITMLNEMNRLIIGQLEVQEITLENHGINVAVTSRNDTINKLNEMNRLMFDQINLAGSSLDFDQFVNFDAAGSLRQIKAQNEAVYQQRLGVIDKEIDVVQDQIATLEDTYGVVAEENLKLQSIAEVYQDTLSILNERAQEYINVAGNSLVSLGNTLIEGINQEAELRTQEAQRANIAEETLDSVAPNLALQSSYEEKLSLFAAQENVHGFVLNGVDPSNILLFIAPQYDVGEQTVAYIYNDNSVLAKMGFGFSPEKILYGYIVETYIDRELNVFDQIIIAKGKS